VAQRQTALKMQQLRRMSVHQRHNHLARRNDARWRKKVGAVAVRSASRARPVHRTAQACSGVARQLRRWQQRQRGASTPLPNQAGQAMSHGSGSVPRQPRVRQSRAPARNWQLLPARVRHGGKRMS